MSKYVKQIFLNPIYDFLPLVVFLITTNLWQIYIGLTVSFGLTVVLFIASVFIRNKILSWNVFVAFLLFSLFAIVLQVAPIYIQRDIIFILPEIAVSCYLIFFVIFQKTIKKYLKKKNIVPTYCYFEEYYRLIKYFLALVFTYVLLFFIFREIKYLPVYLDTFLFVSMFTIIIYEFVRVSIIRSNFLKEEWYPIVNAEGYVIGKIEKKESLSSPQKFLHPIIRVHIIKNDMIYLQKRIASDLIFPGKWDTAISNHIHFSETVDDCINTTAKIRYGIKDIKPIFLTKYKIETKDEKQLAFLYYTNQFKELRPLCSNIEEGKFWTIKQVKAELNSGIFTENFVKEFEYLCSNSICKES